MMERVELIRDKPDEAGIELRSQVFPRGGAPALVTFPADLLVVTKFASKRGLGPTPMAVDQALGGAVSRQMQAGGFRGEVGEHVLVEREGKEPRYVLLLGLGEAGGFDCAVLSRVFEHLLLTATRLNIRSMAVPVLMKAIPRGSVPNLKTLVRLLQVARAKLGGANGANVKPLETTFLCRPQAMRFLVPACRKAA
jgi:hypothetical protein